LADLSLIFSLIWKIWLLFVISVNFIPYWESLHTHTHCMSWVIYLKFLSAVKFVLIEVFRRTYSYVQTSTVLRLASLFLPYTHLCIFIDLSWHVVCFSREFLLRLWHSLHNCSHSMILIVSSIILLSLCAFRILEYLLIWIFFVHENHVCVLCWYWYIWVIWIAIFVCVILGHPIDSCHNTTFFLGLTRSNISLWC
jgi:hypothetical protein